MSHPRLDILSGDLTGRSYLVDEDEFVIGRGRNCDLVIPKRYISREHARIVRSRNAFVIDGLSEKNPVVVSDRPIREHTLQDGDVFEVCGIQFRFSIPRPGSPKRGVAANHTSTLESQSGIGWRDEDTEAGFGDQARQRQARQTSKSAGDSWDDAPQAPRPSRSAPSSKQERKRSRPEPAAPVDSGGWQDEADWKDAGDADDDGWRSASASAKGPGPAEDSEEGWSADPGGAPADSWSDEQPARKAAKRTGAEGREEESWEEDSWSAEEKVKGGRKSGVVFEVDDNEDPNDATGALPVEQLSNLSSGGSGERESDAERTAELNKQLDPDDPDYDPFAQIDSEGPKTKVVDPNREKLLRVMAALGLAGVFLAYLVYAKVTAPVPPEESEHPTPAQTYVGGSALIEVTWQAKDRPQKPSRIPWALVSRAPEDGELLSNDSVAKVEWVLPKLERSLFLVHGLGEGTTSFKIFYPLSNRLVTYPIEVSGEDPHATERDKRRAEFRNKSPRELAQRMKESFESGERYRQGRTLPQKESYYRKAYLKYGEALDAAEALVAAEARRGGKTSATSDWAKKCKESEVRAQEEWDERLTRELGRYRNLVADGSAGLSDRSEQLRNVLRLIGHTCDARFRRFETVLRDEYGSSLLEREACPHDEG